jgi:hypothetical protein
MRYGICAPDGVLLLDEDSGHPITFASFEAAYARALRLAINFKLDFTPVLVDAAGQRLVLN